MILADKIIRERKKLGMSQEELAEKMNVSRQAVSKWESAQSIPDIEKILQLSGLFGVTTDYLLKDDMETEEYSRESEAGNIRKVTLKEAGNYLALRKTASRNIAVGTFLCIIAVIPLLILCAVSASQITVLSAAAAAAIGLALLFVIIAPAIGLFVYTGIKNSPYEFLEKEPFETEYGVIGMVKEQYKAFSDTYAKFNIIGTIFCILSPIALFIGAFSEDGLKAVVALTITLLIAGIGSVFFILAGVRHESMQRLLKEGDYSDAGKKSITGTVSAVYWLMATAVYLLMLFLSDNGSGSGWRSGNSWVIWPVAGVLFPVVQLICTAIQRKKDND